MPDDFHDTEGDEVRSNGHAPDAHSNGHAPDAHGKAALLLVESLIHGLASRAVLSVGEAIEIIDIAADVELELHQASGSPAATPPSLLAPLSASLRFDTDPS